MNVQVNIAALDRHTGLGGTDAKRIVEADWYSLYQEKVGLREPDDLSRVFKVQLGSYTESFHREWVAQREGWAIVPVLERRMHPTIPFMFAHLDGWIADLDVPLETKHTRSGATLREKAQYYMPQLQHYLAVTGRDYLIFSIIAGNDEPEHCRVEANAAYIDELIQMETSFWWHVENMVPPDITPTGKQAELQHIGTATLIDGYRDYDMTGSNAWANEAAAYLEHQEAAKKFEAAKSAIKALVPADAACCNGHGITIKRDKRGALRFS